MKNRQTLTLLSTPSTTTLMLILMLCGCSSSTSIQIDAEFPNVLATPKPISATIIFDDNFSNYRSQPVKNIDLDIGTAQQQLFKNVFQGLFRQVEFTAPSAPEEQQNSLIIKPSVREVQISTPSDNYLNVFEVWIKYNLAITTADGETLTNWYMPAYGKTPDSFTKSKSVAIENATINAIRDAGAKIMLDFYRIPAVHDWVLEQHPEAG